VFDTLLLPFEICGSNNEGHGSPSLQEVLLSAAALLPGSGLVFRLLPGDEFFFLEFDLDRLDPVRLATTAALSDGLGMGFCESNDGTVVVTGGVGPFTKF
jgi:hypothetical protein